MANDIVFIDQPDALAKACAQLQTAEWLALDTEFLRERTYHPRLCLVQIAVPGHIFCIDPLAVPDLGPLFELLFREDLLKVVHAGRQDFEIFHHIAGRVPAPVFDTQLAAPLLGYGDQLGYGNLVRERLGVQLGKAHTRTDWSQRPLSDDQIRYAADDVRYLAELFPAMRRELAERGRLDWLAEDFARLCRPETYTNPPESAWRRIKAAQRMKGGSLAVLQALAAWRETEAQRSDRPRKWVLSDEVIETLARMKPRSRKELERVRGLNDAQRSRIGDTLLALIEQARERKPEPLDRGERPRPLTAAEEALVDVLTGVVRLLAAEAGLHPTVLTGRKGLEALVRGERSGPLFEGWRAQAVGRPLVEILDGQRTLRVGAEGLVLA